MQNSNITDDIKRNTVYRQRPMQKSMFVSQNQVSSYQSPTNRLASFEFTPLKKSFNSVADSPATSLTSNTSQSNLNFNSNSLNFHKISASTLSYETRLSGQSEVSNQNYTLKGLLSPTKNESKSLICPQDNCRLGSKNDKKQSSACGSIIKQVMNQITEKHLPGLLNNFKKQISNEISKIRLQVNYLRDEAQLKWKKYEQLYNQMIKSTPHINNLNNFTNGVGGKDKIVKIEDISELQTNYFLLESKIHQIQIKIAQNSKILSEFSKTNDKLQNQLKKTFKIGVSRSILPSIKLQYNETFTIKENQQIRNSKQQQVILFSHIYYIDRLGYLLDSQNRYLINNNGNQIRLEERHLQLLESQNIIAK